MVRMLVLLTIIFLSSNSFAEEKPSVKAENPAAHNHDHKSEEKPKTTQVMTRELAKIQTTDVVIGKDNAPNIMIEYASFSCIHCAHFYNDVFPAIKEKYIDTGKLKFVFRNYPLNEPALRASALVRCAPKDKKSGYVKTLFKTIEKWAYEKDFLEKLKSIAKIGGMTDNEFAECMKNKEVEQAILAEQLKASSQLNLQSTPTFYLNGKYFENLGKEDYLKALEKRINGRAAATQEPESGSKAKETQKSGGDKTSSKE